jgi:hypothetical protein
MRGVNRRTVVVGLVAALIHPHTARAGNTGTGGRWMEEWIPVRYYGPAEHLGALNHAWEAINAAMPPERTHFVVSHAGDVGCGDVPEQFAPGAITVCVGDTGHSDGSAQWMMGADRAIASVHIVLNDRTVDDLATICHEAMHAVSAINDDYDSEKDSCVHGRRSSPGKWDRWWLAKAYDANPGKEPKGRKKRR